ncbi:RNA polymerase sigma factor [Capnocytophaga cynodegmi]|uniref:RNA polymerase sigma factor n=1 Tax=Capnocytophaga cynodegmi TaxID=28189 RepID=UPI000380B708|nr:sigma-70 family RNA polymerase sigma factor [Capnocytophaga cynodegmi]CEN34490.1 Sigma-W factor [Capnocytophaga cynodegmi]
MTNPTQILIEVCRQNDPKAQLGLYRQYAKAMYNTAFRMFQQQDKAEDAVQEAFIKVFQKLDEFRGENNFGSWLKRIVINEALMMIRQEKQIRYLEETFIDPIDDNEQEKWSFQEEEVKILLYALSLLPEKLRVILNLSLIEGFDNEEICEILHISDGNCRTTLSRAKKSLRETIEKLKNERK